MPLLLRTRSIIALIVALTLLICVIGASYFLVARQVADQAAVQHSLDVKAGVARVMSLLQDAETGQRGFLLTHKEEYLAPYNYAVPQVEAEIQALATKIADNEHQSQRLAELHESAVEKLAELRQTIDLAREDKFDAALARVDSGEGREFMNQIREKAALMTAAEQQLQNERQAQSARTASLARNGVTLALLLTMLLGALTIRDSHQLIASAVNAHDALQVANTKLMEEMRQKERVEHQLRQSQKLEAVGQLTGGIAHDFNNMLAVVIGSLNLLKRRVERGEKDFLKFADSALDGAERAAVLTHRLLAFARQQPLVPQPVDCNKFVAGMSDMLRRTLGDSIKVETVLAGGLWRTFVDPSQLESAILNLAVNGRDAMPVGGKLTIETANASLDDAYAAQNTGAQAGQYALICVTDTGSGMTPDIAAKAFDPFFTTKGAGKGTGLGLSQVFGFVKQSGGHIKIYSEPAQGTAIKVYLPRFFGDDAEPARASVAATEPIPVGSVDTVVLVVEDEARMRVLTVEAFRDLGYSVLEADGPAMALRVIAERSDIALLFTDVVMPEMSGRQLAEEALRVRPDMKIIYTTGFSRNAVIHNGVLDNDVNFLAKPFSIEQLARKVGVVLRAADSEQS
jgi:signal transduction histidine kinase/ActR/RegA family two-component response regulator